MAEAAEEFPFFLERLRSAFDGPMLVDIAPETSLSQVGLDSLEMLRLVVCIEDLAGFVPDQISSSEEAHRTGWTRFRDRLADGSGWLCGWTSTIPSERADFDEVQNYRSTDGRQAIYDAVDGNVIGFSFAFLGAFTPEQVAEPGFDPASMRVHRHGCDPLLDSSCQARP